MTKHLWKDRIKGGGGDWAPSQILSGGHGMKICNDDTTGPVTGRAPRLPPLCALWNSESNQCNSFTMTLLFAWITQNRTAQWNIYITTNEWRELKPSFATLSTFFSSATRRTILNVESVSCNQQPDCSSSFLPPAFRWSYVFKMILLDLCKHRWLDDSFSTAAGHLQRPCDSF